MQVSQLPSLPIEHILNVVIGSNSKVMLNLALPKLKTKSEEVCVEVKAKSPERPVAKPETRKESPPSKQRRDSRRPSSYRRPRYDSRRRSRNDSRVRGRRNSRRRDYRDRDGGYRDRDSYRDRGRDRSSVDREEKQPPAAEPMDLISDEAVEEGSAQDLKRPLDNDVTVSNSEEAPKKKRKKKKKAENTGAGAEMDVFEVEDLRRSKQEEFRRKEAEEARRDDNTIFAIVSPTADERDIYEFFSQNGGKVRDIQLLRDQRSGRSKGFAYVEFYLQNSAVSSLGCNGALLKGQPVRIQASQAQKNREAQAQKLAYQQAQLASEQMGLRIFVSNLTGPLESMSSEELQQLFEGFGPIEFVDLYKDPYTKKSKGYAFITFKSAADGKAAIMAMDGFYLAGQTLRLGIASSGNSSIPTETPNSGPGMINMLSGGSTPHTNIRALMPAGATPTVASRGDTIDLSHSNLINQPGKQENATADISEQYPSRIELMEKLSQN